MAGCDVIKGFNQWEKNSEGGVTRCIISATQAKDFEAACANVTTRILDNPAVLPLFILTEKKMTLSRKLLTLMAAAFLATSLAACGGGSGGGSPTNAGGGGESNAGTDTGTGSDTNGDSNAGTGSPPASR